MPVEIRELIIRASVQAEKVESKTSTATEESASGFRRQSELADLKKMIEQKNER